MEKLCLNLYYITIDPYFFYNEVMVECEKNGEKYSHYCGSVKKLVPFLWIFFFCKVHLEPMDLKFVVIYDLFIIYLKYKHKKILNFSLFLYRGLNLS